MQRSPHPLTPWFFGLVVACGSGSGKVVAGGQVSVDASAQVPGKTSATPDAPEPAVAAGGAPSPSSTSAQAGATLEAPPPEHDPEAVREVVSRTAAPVDDRARLGLRLGVIEQGPGSRWIVAVANRGEAPLAVNFDLRTLSLEIEPPPPPPPEPGKKAKPAPKPKKLTCALPKEVRPTKEEPRFEVLLDPGEAVVDAFDPRLYCSPETTSSPFVPGAIVTIRLGFAEKTKTVWRKGKPEKQVLEQSPPFVARLFDTGEPEPVKAPEAKKDARSGSSTSAAGGELAFERYAVKEIISPPVVLGEAYAPAASPVADDQPLALSFTSGSDARTEREATVTVSLINRSSRPQTVYFRRELVSFEVSGPTGLVTCDAGPDERAPERLAFVTLAPGKRIRATSRLIELCPMGALRLPGLYFVHGRFDTWASGEAFGLDAFQGRLVSERPALVRVRKGWAELPAQHEPLRVQLGGAPEPAGSSSP